MGLAREARAAGWVAETWLAGDHLGVHGVSRALVCQLDGLRLFVSAR